ncbi:ABC transporter transmembrane domain-containing protein [Saccharospirillum salsuginis]|uniref:Multidrug ABC transporter ATP-binding protein n=1 Tax=Saccharospirillum salsuginis TaxID=418750 RepID=A0A918K371_9GAMM|nr:ABC transporter transmembrane domain-containing protein [Saccharospirillum salsuginis]GGX43370.1 multidrug ABC transporter ATP-binding protein [Saccharospirillum salsuginis]
MNGTFSRLLRYGLAYRRLLVQAIVLLAIATGGNVLGPYLIKVFIDSYLTPGVWVITPIAGLVIAYLVSQLISAVCFFQQAIRFNHIALDVVQTIREQVFSRVMRLPLAFFDHTPTGSLISRITNDTETIKDLYVNVISVVIQNAIRMLGILIAMAFLDFKLMLICSALVPAVVGVMLLYQRLSTPVFQRVRTLLSDINARLNEGIQGMAVIQLMNQQARFSRAFEQTSTDHYRAKIRNMLIDGLLLRALVDFLYMLVLAALLFAFGWDFLSPEGAIQVGVIYAFLNYLGNLTEPMIDMISRLNLFQQALVSADRVFQLLDETPESIPTQPLEPRDGSVRFEIEAFSYDRRKTVLTDIQLDIEPGSFVGIVGHTGSGKSTLMSLLMGFYPVELGTIRVGEVPLDRIDPAIRSRRIGLVQQDPFIFMGTIADNIRLDLDLTDAEVEQAAKQAQLHEAILRMPQGYQTSLTERGGNLSTGQRQLLSLARTLARQPDILILDEATANIDSHTEALIQSSLMQLRGRITIIAIAHRLSTVMEADHLVVLHQGHIQQQGRHAQLMAEEGLYKHMYELQQQKDPLVGQGIEAGQDS